MAKKTIIPDFTLALGADLREAAAKMREMSRPPAHQAASAAPQAAASSNAEERTETPSDGDGLKNEISAPQEAAPNASSSVANVQQNNPKHSQLSVDVVPSHATSAGDVRDAVESAAVSPEKTDEASDFSDHKYDDTVTNKTVTDSDIPHVVDDKKHENEPTCSPEKDAPASAEQKSPLSEAVPGKNAPFTREQETGSFLPSSELSASPRPFSPQQAKESSGEPDASGQRPSPAMNPAQDAASSETPFTTPLSPKEVSSPIKEPAAQQPPYLPQPQQTVRPAPEKARPRESNEAPKAQTDTRENVASSAPPTTNVTDGHQQSLSVDDSHNHVVTAYDKDSSSLQSQIVIDGHLRSSSVHDYSLTVDDRHSFLAPTAKTGIGEPSSQERLTDVSPSFVRRQALAYGPTSAPVKQEAVHTGAAEHPATSPQSEKNGAFSFPPEMSPCVTMTVTDTNNSHGSQSIKPLTSTGGVSIASAALQEVPLGGARQTLLKALDTLRGQSPQVMVNLKRLAAAIGLSYGTVRNTISRLVREGVICTTQVRTGEAHGVCIEFLDDSSLQSLTTMGAHSFPQPSFPPIQSSAVISSHQQPMTVNTTSPMTKDDTSIWSADARLIADLWPYAAQAGLSPAHLAQVRRAYQVQGWDADNVSRCLRYLDWELAQGGAGPEHVAGWLRVMQRQGHYPRPEGYVDPEVLRLQQQAQEQRELAQARQDAAAARAFLDTTSRHP